MLIRTDRIKDQKIIDYTNELINRFWRPDDFKYDKDKIDWSRMSEEVKEFFLKNFKSQTLADSFISEEAIPVIDGDCHKIWNATFKFNENIHAQSYSFVLKGISNDPTEILDSIEIIPEIRERIKVIVDNYKKHPIHTQYILEAAVFQTSFPITFAFDQKGLMKQNASMIQSIYLDELIHIKYDRRVIKTLFPEVPIHLYQEAFETEMKWIDYLYENKTKEIENIITEQSIRQYTIWNFHNLLNSIKGNTNWLPKKPKSNPLPWFSQYAKINEKQLALQETVSNTYLSDIIDWS